MPFSGVCLEPAKMDNQKMSVYVSDDMRIK